MKKILESDWLREMHFLVNSMQKWVRTVQKKGNRCKKGKQTEHTDWLINKGTHTGPNKRFHAI